MLVMPPAVPPPVLLEPPPAAEPPPVALEPPALPPPEPPVMVPLQAVRREAITSVSRIVKGYMSKSRTRAKSLERLGDQPSPQVIWHIDAESVVHQQRTPRGSGLREKIGHQ